MTTSSPRSGPDVGYWAALSVASVFGASLGDVISHDLHLGHWRGLLPLCLLLGAIRGGAARAWLGIPAAYWLSVVIIRAGATNVADLASHDLRLGSMALVGVLGVPFLWAMSVRDRATSIAATRQHGLPDTGTRYWITLFLAGTLGTVLGDDASGLYGQEAASILLCAMVLVLVLLRQRAVVDGTRGYWSTVLGARTAGTSVGDLLADHTSLGLAGSTAATGLLLIAMLSARWPADATGLQPDVG